MSKVGVLVFPFADKGAGWEAFLSLRESRRFEFVGASSAGLFDRQLCDDHEFISSTVDDPDLPSELAALMTRHGAEILLPAHDSVMLRLKPIFPDQIPGSPLSTVELCRSKEATYRALEGSLRVPAHLDPVEFPCFIKPDKGQGSRDARLIETQAEFDRHYRDDMLALEYLPGTEYTVDCFTDARGELAHCAPRERVRVEDGIAVETRLVDLPEAVASARTISRELGMRGAWFCQFKRDREGRLTLLEVAPRIAGASGVNRTELGVNLTEWMLTEHLDGAGRDERPE